MRVLFVTAEAYPLAKTGGLADVSRALPIALRSHGIDVRLLMPGYPRAYVRIENPRIAAKIEPTLGVSDATLVAGICPDTDLPVWLIDSPSLFRRNGGLYQDDDGKDWPDNALRFAFLSRVGAKMAAGEIALDWTPDLVHAHDWHAGLLPLYASIAKDSRPSTVFTTHNMAFQGNFAPQEVPALPEHVRSADIEFYGRISYLKAGLRYADRVTTVSPTYAREILTPEFGFGLDGVLRDRAAHFGGILNGIDDAIWNPSTDPHLAQNYRAGDVSGKRVCRRTLQLELGLEPAPETTPVIGFVSRLTHQKMADVLADVVPRIVEQGAQVVIVGEGDRAIENALLETGRRHDGHVAVTIGYNEHLAHKLQAGGDILLAPARFEPCGLSQLYALRYGTLPIVRRTGGLADTVVDANPRTIAERTATGFVFEQADAEGLMSAVTRALNLFRDPLHWRLLQLQAMTRSFSWDSSAAKYVELYKQIAQSKPEEELERSEPGEEYRAAG